VPAIAFLAGVALLWVVPAVGIVGLILTLLLLVARFDNKNGTFLPLAVLIVIVLLVMALLLGGLALIHALASGAR
jgi:hypothetical protein